ncbi:A/G-specific adenine glycosylase [Nitrosomonas sp.]|uniref:A/G-specific adenine glycosylase n=1 Tax=Nitrosomonas sp. TaxID=42353 RepID=UPI0026320CFC|nr:A/G-specific adenine glycosylase [Nitrosomonas sp.]MCW5601274.1 A/G-specific adenine glycosylase [Nitrosomonas sp.]
MSTFANTLIHWQRQHGRRDLPWQNTRDPYAIWIAEIMLQQTQVATVIPYYQRFITIFPDIETLARASLDAVLALWSGLGYYTRGRNIHKAACLMVARYQGRFPSNAAAIEQLPGIGRSTAAAIAAFAYGERCAILDGNVKRVLTRYFGINGYPGEKKTEILLWEKAESLLPQENTHECIATYTQAQMDLGALVCTRHHPQCRVCPLRSNCVAFRENRTTKLPAPKPRKPLPNREATFLLMIDQNSILLEKRSNTGIWGGLWCLPQLPASIDLKLSCMQYSGINAAFIANLPVIDHTFTHFKLRISTCLLKVIDRPNNSLEEQVWVTIDEALNLAIPAPVRKILMEVSSSTNFF